MVRRAIRSGADLPGAWRLRNIRRDAVRSQYKRRCRRAGQGPRQLPNPPKRIAAPAKAAFGAISPPCSALPHSPPRKRRGRLDFDASAALRLINNYRAAKGVAPLAIDPQATAAAEMLAKDMALHDRMSHTGPNGQDVGKRLLAAGYSYSVASENVAVGQATIEETVAGWKASPGNSRNMLLAKAKHIGIAYENKPDSRYKTFWVLVVAAP